MTATRQRRRGGRRLAALLTILVAVVLIALFERSRRGGGPGDRVPGETRGSSLDQLAALGYLTWVDAEDSLEKRGVTLHDPTRSSGGLNLYSPRNDHRALLVDMSGRVRHQWSLAVEPGDRWQHVELLPDGGLLAIVEEVRLVKLDRQSSLLWTLDAPVHHDVARIPTGGYYVLTHEPRSVFRDGRSSPVLIDSILRLDEEGAVVGRLDLLELFRHFVTDDQWADLDQWLTEFAEPMKRLGPQVALKSGSPADLFHANSIEILPRDVTAIGRRGDLLISLRDIDTIAVVDFEAGELRWSWGQGSLERQHHPTLLDNDNILVFDNRGGPGRHSRVVELDPSDGRIVWSHEGDPPESFFSALRGGSQRLPNGNTLITESDRGRVFEITSGGETVWEYYNPLVIEAQKRRSSIYRTTRIAPGALTWLDPATSID